MFKFTKTSIPALFALLVLLAYGLLIPWLGFYWDDWAFAWIGKFLGPAEFLPAFAPFRPFIAPLFVLTTNLLPPIPVVWQIFGLLIRFLSGLAAWWTLNQIWRERKAQNLTVSLLFLVFPGYSQQWVALTHINQEWVYLIAYLLSIGLTASALHNPGKTKTHTTLALLLLFWGLFPTEYFLGMEAIRLLVIYFGVEASNFRLRVKATAKRWLPYLLLWLANAGWLAYYYTRGGYNSYGVEARPNSAGVLVQIISGMADALYKAIWISWTQVILRFADAPSAPTTIIGLALVILTFTLLSIYRQNLHLETVAAQDTSWAKQALWIGLAGVLAGRIPSLAAGLPLKLQTSYDRLTISIMFASALLVAALLELIVKNEKIRVFALSGLLALAVGMQFTSANDFRRDWERQRNLVWQLVWRMPNIQEQTALITHELPMENESDQAMTAPLNWIYAPDYQAGELLPYAFVNTEKRLGGASLPALKPDAPIYVPYRTVHFEGSTSAAIVIYAPKNGCLRVLDPFYANGYIYSKEDPLLTDAIYLSDPTRILSEGKVAEVPATLFGQEPEHDWCYYSTKAELARQNGHWVEVTRLGNEAVQFGYSPVDAFEWLPFIEGYAYTDKIAYAVDLSEVAIKKEPRLRKGLCELWERVKKRGVSANDEVHIDSIYQQLNCSP